MQHDVLSQQPFSQKPGLLQHPLRRRILHLGDRLQPLQVRPLLEERGNGHPERSRGDAAAPMLVGQAVGDGGLEALLALAGLGVDGAHGAAVDTDGSVPWVRQDVVRQVPPRVLLACARAAALEAGDAGVRRPCHEGADVGEVEGPQGDIWFLLPVIVVWWDGGGVCLHSLGTREAS